MDSFNSSFVTPMIQMEKEVISLNQIGVCVCVVEGVLGQVFRQLWFVRIIY